LENSRIGLWSEQMKITKLEPLILHAPVTRDMIADSTHTLTHWEDAGLTK